MILMHAIEAHDLAISNLALTDRLVMEDRCATLGRSAARMAHEIGNQLSMLPLLELIEDNYSDHADLVQAAGFARQTHQRLVQLISEVKSFVRFERETLAMQSISLTEMVHELVEFLRYDSSLPMERLAVSIEGEPVVKGHKIKLQQVLINLLKNAAHATRGRDDARIKLGLARDGANATLTVADNGCGMTAEVAARIWEPFFTTKGEEGTGLGLDLCKALIEAHGGTIHCDTAPDQGAAFTIRLPLVNATPGEPTAGPTPIVIPNVAGATGGPPPVPLQPV
jgi:C4-dicarboxylate-specific signal transduction histidine kinase